jgi:hypothetical protein
MVFNVPVVVVLVIRREARQRADQIRVRLLA